jgi:putative membrane protein
MSVLKKFKARAFITNKEQFVDQLFSIKAFIAAIVYALLGNILLLISFLIIDKLTPGSLWDVIYKEQNLSVAITVSAMTIALGIIIASAIHG